ncbi:MAG: M20/M25/M40 family metallo-hydrolase [Gemmatimonadales bacterium]
MTRRLLFAAGALALLPAPVTAQPALRDRIRTFRERNEVAIVRELTDLLALRNVATSDADLRTNARMLVAMMERRGVKARILETTGAPPAVYGELTTPGAARTVVFYAHYDGQPVDSSRWQSAPWSPVLRSGPLGPGTVDLPLTPPGGRYDPESRVFARSASDDKSPIVAMLWALDALRAAGTPLSVNLKFFLEGEEEAGSSHLRQILTTHQDLLKADFWLFGDGPVHQTREAQAVFGVRGVMGANLTVYGPLRPLHSGHYGNWAPNANAMMVHLLASMRDTEGRITIAGYYDDVRPPTEAERAAFRSMPAVEEQLIGELALGRTENAPATLAEQLALPALNMSGLAGGRAGAGGSNVIVAESNAYLDFRLVPDQRPERVRELVTAHLQRQGFHVVENEPDSATRRAYPRLARLTWSGGYSSARTGIDSPGARALLAAADAVLGKRIIRVPTLGGSLPLADFVETLGIQFAILPIVNHDNNQHAENENLRLQNLWDGIELYGGVLARMGREWTVQP